MQVLQLTGGKRQIRVLINDGTRALLSLSANAAIRHIDTDAIVGLTSTLLRARDQVGS